MIQSKDIEQQAIMNVAQAMCAAARTAPKAMGVDNLFVCILSGGEIEKLAVEMERLGEIRGAFVMPEKGHIRLIYLM